MKKIISILLLICTLTLCLASCGVSKKDLVGTWRGEWEYNGNTFVSVIEIYDNETYTDKTYKNYNLVSPTIESGKYEIKGNTIILYKTDTKYTVYNYKDGQLENGGHYYARLENN